MKKTRLLLVLALFCFALNEAVGQNSQWDVYNVIPNFKSISFIFDSKDAVAGYSYYSDGSYSTTDYEGGNIKLSIHDDYTVSLNYRSTMYFDHNNYRRSSIPVSIEGYGIIRWQNEGMVLDLNVTTRTSGGKDECHRYVETRNGDQYSWDEYTFPSSESTMKYSYNLEFCNQGFKLINGE